MDISAINSIADARRLFATAAAKDGTTGAAGTNSPQQVRAASRQFEAIILRQLLAPTIEPLMSNGVGGRATGGGGGSVYGYLVTDVLANSLSQGGGLGISKMLEKQLSPKTAAVAAASTAQAAAVYRAGEGHS